jgi:hypothetical protein
MVYNSFLLVNRVKGVIYSSFFFREGRRTFKICFFASEAMLGATQRRLRSLLPLFAARPTRTLVVSSLRSQQQRRRERQNHFDPQPKTKYLRSSNKEEKPSPTVVQSLKDSAVDGIRVSGERKVNPADAVPKFNEANRAHIKKASEFLESKFGTVLVIS